MIREFALAKINLALHVLGRRDDGYHELDSIVAFAGVGDEIEIAPSTEFSVMAQGRFAADLPAAADNIVHKAWGLACEIATARGRVVPPVAITLGKNLPVASGIGGGSADAAAVLRGCLRMAGIAIDNAICAASVKLGADVPVCLTGVACRMRGVGERIDALPDFPRRAAVLVNPGTPVATREVFAAMGLKTGQVLGAAIPDTFDLAILRNDMAAAAMALSPSIRAVLAALESQPGVTLARMSGSGATCFACFDGAANAEAAADRMSAAQPGWWVCATTIG